MYTTVIADDEKLICDSIMSVLNAAAPELKSIQVFQNGMDAYDFVQSHKADIFILDIEMPGRSGLDIAQLLSAQTHPKYVIMITAYQDFDYAKRAIDCDVDAFLTKPISSEQLVSSVRKAISVLDARNHSFTGNSSAYRSMVRALCSQNAKALQEGFYLCNGTAPLNDLTCTRVLIKDESLVSLSPSVQSLMKQALISTVEKDTDEQTTILLEYGDSFEILALSRTTPDLSFLEDAMQIVRYHTNSDPKPEISAYPSFSDYLSNLEFARELDAYFSLSAEGNLKQAQSRLCKFLQSLSGQEFQHFVGYLSENYQLTVEKPDIDTVLKMLSLTLGGVSGNQSNHIVVSACEYIRRNFHSSQLSLESTAGALSISGAHLSRLFKKHTGQTFSDYLLQIRMEHAKFLLDTTSLPTPDVAEATGYDKSAYFRTAFKAYFGVTPLQYRQMTCGRGQNET